MCEYDGLPEIGHACGHNLIAILGVSTSLAIKEAFEKAGVKGKVRQMHICELAYLLPVVLIFNTHRSVSEWTPVLNL